MTIFMSMLVIRVNPAIVMLLITIIIINMPHRNPYLRRTSMWPYNRGLQNVCTLRRAIRPLNRRRMLWYQHLHHSFPTGVKREAGVGWETFWSLRRINQLMKSRLSKTEGKPLKHRRTSFDKNPLLLKLKAEGCRALVPFDCSTNVE